MRAAKGSNCLSFVAVFYANLAWAFGEAQMVARLLAVPVPQTPSTPFEVGLALSLKAAAKQPHCWWIDGSCDREPVIALVVGDGSLGSGDRRLASSVDPAPAVKLVGSQDLLKIIDAKWRAGIPIQPRREER